MSDKDNRREASRSETGTDAELTTPEGTKILGILKDVSIRGVFIQCEQRPELGRICGLRLFLGERGSGERIEGKGRVVRLTGEGVGLELLEVSTESLHHLHNLILYNSPDPDRAQRELEDRLGLKKPPERP